MIPLLAVVALLTTRSYDIRVNVPTTALVVDRQAQVFVSVGARRPLRSLHAFAVPGLDVDAATIDVTLRPAGRDRFQGRFSLPVRGPWYLAVEARDPPAITSITLNVSAPGALPAPFAWAIACLPLALFAIFAASELRRARNAAQDVPWNRPKTLPI
jgi:hypothetical protein